MNINIHISDKRKGFSVIQNSALQDTRITLEARGLLAMVLSLKNLKEISIEQVAKYMDGNTSITSKMRRVKAIFQQLERFGYCKISSGKNEKNQFFSSYDIFEIPPILEKAGAGFPHRKRRTGNAAPETPTRLDRLGSTDSETLHRTCIDSSIKESNKENNKESNKENNKTLSTKHAHACDAENIKEDALNAEIQMPASTPPAPPPPPPSGFAFWKDSGYAPNTTGGKEKFIRDVKGYMWNYHYLHQDLTEDNFDFDAFYLRCDTIFSNGRATEGLTPLYRSEDFAKKAVVMLMAVKNGKYQHKDFLKKQNELENNGNTNYQRNNTANSGSSKPTFAAIKEAFGI